ncbi:BatD family protein [Bacteroidota bacterium]
MTRLIKVLYLLFITLILTFSYTLKGQNITVQLGPDEIAMNQAFTITVTVENDKLKSYSGFPEIPGFYKRGTSSSTSTNIINGRVTSRQSIIQNYIAQNEGTYTLKPFTMVVNGQNIQSQGKMIKVGPARQQRNRYDPFANDPFDDFFGRREESQEFVDVKEDAFLALTSDKDEVYLGEGFTVTLAFYVSESNRAPLQFYEPARQLSDILKNIKPANSWEENYNIDDLNSVKVSINNKQYSQYKIYQATYYPLNTEDIDFPSVPFKMIKYKVAKNRSIFGRNRQEDFKTYYSKPRTVKVVELPPHPLKDVVSVGNYKLDEELSSTYLKTGNSFTYNFKIIGEGNISAIEKPNLDSDAFFEFYPPNIRQNVDRGNNRVTGSKAFNYYIIPNEPGNFELGDYFQWIYFNITRDEYDTLQSQYVVQVTGESKRNEYILSNDLGSFYDTIELEGNSLIRLDRYDWVRIFTNLFILLILVLSIFFLFKK